jgi:hypothetical protein
MSEPDFPEPDNIKPPEDLAGHFTWIDSLRILGLYVAKELSKEWQAAKPLWAGSTMPEFATIAAIGDWYMAQLR